MYIIVAGGGAVGYNLTKVLLAQGHEVVLIEMDRARAQRISDELGSVVIPQRADEGRWMLEAGVERADVVISATGDDEDNLIICQLAELLALRAKVKKPRTIARVNHPRNEQVMRRLGVDATVSPTSMMLTLIEEELDAHPAVHLMTLRQAGIELMEFIIPGTSPGRGQDHRPAAAPARHRRVSGRALAGDDPPGRRHRSGRRGLRDRPPAHRPRARGARALHGQRHLSPLTALQRPRALRPARKRPSTTRSRPARSRCTCTVAAGRAARSKAPSGPAWRGSHSSSTAPPGATLPGRSARRAR